MKSYKLNINGQKYVANIIEYSEGHAKVNINGNDYLVEIENDIPNPVPRLERQEKAMPVAPQMSLTIGAKTGDVKAPLPGVIISIPVKEGDTVKKGDKIVILEAMKMESELAAPVSGKILKIHKKEKAPVQEGDILITIEPDASEIDVVNDSRKSPPQRRQADIATRAVDKTIRAPLPGTVLDIYVQVGDMVTLDQTVLVLEAMKMESEIHSHAAGKVKKINVSKGAAVNDGDALIELEV